MKTRYKIWIIIVSVLVIAGITGTVMIHYVFFQDERLAEQYYTRGEAEYLLINLARQDSVLGLDEEDLEAGFTVEDARTALQVILAVNDEQIDELNSMEDDTNSILGVLTEKKDSYVLSMEEFRTLYEYMMNNIDDPAVKVENLMVLDAMEETVYSENGPEVELGKTQQDDSVIRHHYIYSPESAYTISAYSENKTDAIYQAVTEAPDLCIRVYVWNDQILEYTGISREAVLMTNVWLENIEDPEEQKLHVFVNGYHKSYSCRLPETGDMAAHLPQGKLADILVLQGIVTDIVLKSDLITAKVLSVSEEGVELEGYGVLRLSQNYKIYKIYGEPAVEPTSQILVGYNTTNFVIADGVIEAALITEPIKAENIRVVLRNSDYSSLYHECVVVSSDAPFTLYFHDQEKKFEAGEELELTCDNGYMANGRVTIGSNTENGTLTIQSITRNQIHPSYRGILEIVPYGESGLLIVNELSLEEYLYAVVPSEMPVSYGNVSLEVQAICARGYAYMKMQDGTYAKYGAHLDDSTMTQVYHAVDETEESILAVKETYGMVPVYDGAVIQAYFFSTSCGTTCNNTEVWDGEALPYLRDKLEGSSADVDGSEETEDCPVDIQELIPIDLSSEALFRAFIQGDMEYDMFEAEYPFYRWSIDYSPEEMTHAVNAVLADRYAAAPDKILTLQKDGSYISQSVSDIGDIVNVSVTQRGTSGIVKELLIEGTEATVIARGQANARALMTPYNVIIKRQDGSESSAWSMIPSPFYYVEKTQDGHYLISGGGFGHGVGLSQNGAKALADRGYTAEEIIRHYYTDVDLINIYR